MTAQWFEKRFVESAEKLRFDCIACGRAMWFPPSKHGKYRTCGGACAETVRAAKRNERMRTCQKCGKQFLARSALIAAGLAKFCSQACNDAGRAAGNTAEARAKANQRRRESIATGKVKFPSGPDHHSWKGGHEAYLARHREKTAAQTREYRKKNGEKAREWRKKRRGIGRLPPGTVKKIGAAQRWKCAVCRADVKRGYHVDHVMPLALGGEHAPHNLQLLCGPCNVRKSAKHPVEFMQSRGFLL